MLYKMSSWKSVIFRRWLLRNCHSTKDFRSHAVAIIRQPFLRTQTAQKKGLLRSRKRRARKRVLFSRKRGRFWPKVTASEWLSKIPLHSWIKCVTSLSSKNLLSVVNLVGIEPSAHRDLSRKLRHLKGRWKMSRQLLMARKDQLHEETVVSKCAQAIKWSWRLQARSFCQAA